MILSDRTIEEYAMLGVINPFNKNQLQPASYDLQLSEVYWPSNDLKTFGIITPGQFVLGSTMEWIEMPIELVGRLEGKSSLARRGLIIHTAGFIDPGFRGNLTLEITNLGPYMVELKEGMLIAQIAFSKLDRPAAKPYGHPDLNSHYQDSRGVISSAIIS